MVTWWPLALALTQPAQGAWYTPRVVTCSGDVRVDDSLLPCDELSNRPAGWVLQPSQTVRVTDDGRASVVTRHGERIDLCHDGCELTHHEVPGTLVESHSIADSVLQLLSDVLDPPPSGVRGDDDTPTPTTLWLDEPTRLVVEQWPTCLVWTSNHGTGWNAPTVDGTAGGGIAPSCEESGDGYHRCRWCAADERTESWPEQGTLTFALSRTGDDTSAPGAWTLDLDRMEPRALARHDKAVRKTSKLMASDPLASVALLAWSGDLAGARAAWATMGSPLSALPTRLQWALTGVEASQ